MEVASRSHNNESAEPSSSHVLGWMKAIVPHRIINKIAEKAKEAKKLGIDDPRRIIHSFKVGLAITLVSLFYYFKPLYEGFGVSAMWAVLTVVVVFEFSVGATLGKGLNRVCATLLGGGLGVGAHWLACYSGKNGEPVVIAVFVFIVAATVTFVRFFPKMKARYDYGLMVFILTFCLVSVSGYREDEVIRMAHERVVTIAIGSCTSLLVCILICPVWIGEDLHNQVADNLEKLGKFLEGFGGEYFKISNDAQSNTDKSFLQGYKSALNTKNSEENMANLARWEPRHGRFKFRHPWKLYLKAGTLTRDCAYKIEALSSHLNSENSTPWPEEIQSKIQESYTMISSETGKALKELASAIKTMARSSSVNTHIANSNAAAETLKSPFKISVLEEDTDLLEIVPAATVASLLMDVVTCTEKIAACVNDLASQANFNSPNNNNNMIPGNSRLLHRGSVQPISGTEGPHHVITIGE
ncbi:Aluminum-activated malate transporter 2 [Citrus sinensis]|uniref:Aluminum-activated malate transporter 2 n=2 Tax=Citrus TaxID=2706 RepID=A0ACB8IQI8_CITSI|nr:aluminum-activated malate transporter 2 [Citrus x clementina]KAH9699484.1 Aluminum-activated malate transporter 2 [Citrus sinensis]